MNTRLFLSLALGATLVPCAFAQDVQWDSSGNGLLQGGYNFRHVIWQVADDSGALKRQVALTGRLDFDGQGNYTLTAQVADSDAGSGLQSFTNRGTYAISAAGYGYLTSPVSQDSTVAYNERVFGVVSNGIFLGSRTETRVNDLLIAVRAASPATTSDNFSGKYWATEMNFPSLDPTTGRDALWPMTADGSGSVGTIAAVGYIGTRTRRVTQNLTGVRYTFSNGIGTMSFGGTFGTNTLLAGDRVFFLSPDGNFIFGGSLNGYNMMVGVKALSGKPNADTFSGLYYQAGADAYVYSDGVAEWHSFVGSLRASAKDQTSQRRLYVGAEKDPYNFNFWDVVDMDETGSFDDWLSFQNIVGAEGAIRIGFGTPYDDNTLGLSVAVKIAPLSGEGVWLDPTGLTNAASEVTFTEGVARGELIRLKGTGLAGATVEDATFPTKLADVQVLINGRPSPIKSVSPTEVVAIVPYATKEGIARIQVLNAGAESNAITAYLNLTSPGFFTTPPGGIGYITTVRGDGSAVGKDAPARNKEKVSMLLNGLGDVSPEVLEGTPAPEKSPAAATSTTEIYLRGDLMDSTFIGLAPNKIGLYQADVTLGAIAKDGDAYIDLYTPDAANSMVYLPVLKSAVAVSGDPSVRRRPRPAHVSPVKPDGWHPSGGARK